MTVEEARSFRRRLEQIEALDDELERRGDSGGLYVSQRELAEILQGKLPPWTPTSDPLGYDWRECRDFVVSCFVRILTRDLIKIEDPRAT